jgi:hypothetical protein
VQRRSRRGHDDPSPDEYVGRSPEGTAGRLGAARRSAREADDPSPDEYVARDAGCLIARAC